MIRLGNPFDFPAVDAFDPFGGNRRDELAAGRLLVAEVDGRIAGYVSFSPAGFIGRPFVHFLAVAPEHRRQGVAVALLHEVAAFLDAERLFISTEEGNAPMEQLLERDGWTAAGCVRGVNDGGAAECFYYRDVAREPSSPT